MPGKIEKNRELKGAAKKFGVRKKVDSDEEPYKASNPTDNKGIRAAKKEKDENMPKKPQTAYFHFMGAKRNEVKTADPSLTFGALTKKLTEMWKALNEEERKEYDDLAANDKQRYQDEMEERGLLKKKADVEADAPKKPMRSFFLYSNEARKRMKDVDPDMKNPDILKAIAAEWKLLPEETIQLWKQKATDDKVRYAKEMEEYKKKCKDVN